MNATQTQDSFLKKYKTWAIAFVLFGMYVSFGMSWLAIIPLKKEIHEFLGLAPKDTRGVLLYTIISYAKSFFPIMAGILAGRWGLTKTMRLSGILIMAGALVPFVPNYWASILARFMFGVGGAIWVTLMGAVTLQIFEPKLRPMVNALNGVAVTVGVVITLQVSTPLNALLGWKTTLALYSAISGLFLVMLYAVGDLAEEAPKTGKGPSILTSLKAYGAALKLPVTWITSLAFTGPLAIYLVLNYWLKVYYPEALGFTPGETNNLLSLMNIGGIVGSVVTGFLLQKVNKTKVFIWIASFALPATTILSLVLQDKALIAVALFSAGVAMFLSVSPLVTLLQSQPNMNPALIGMILGTMFSATYIASALAPSLVGWGYKAGYSLQTLLILCSLSTFSPLAAVVLPEKAD